METEQQRDAWWRMFESRISHNEPVDIDEYTANKRFNEIMQEKENKQVEQIIGRLMYKPCFCEPDKLKMALGKKFRLLALYHFSRRDYEKFGEIVTSSIIREWPVTIYHAEEGNGDIYKWDRAPLSIEIKDRSIRKDGKKYVMRVLALEEEDIGTILSSAQCRTELLEQDVDGNEREIQAYIHEPIKEGEQKSNKRECASDLSGAVAPKLRKTNGTAIENQMSNYSHFISFDHSPETNQQIAFRSDKKREDFIDDDSGNVAFKINNIAMFDRKNRAKITKKYVMKSHFVFLFTDYSVNHSFYVKTIDPKDPHQSYQYPTYNYQSSTKSMPFEGSSNPSIHWEKSMPFIWNILYEYYNKKGQLTDAEKHSNGQMLIWGHIKDMVRNFISCSSDHKIRPLIETEMRTISRMILTHRLAEINKEKGAREGTWILNNLSEHDQNEIATRLLGKTDNVVKTGKSFTHALNKELCQMKLPENQLVKLSDFTDRMMCLSRAEPVRTASLYSWLHGVSEMISGDFLHKNPRKTVEMFNRELITLRSRESARKSINKIVEHYRDNKKIVKILMLRMDEREESSLLFEFINPSSDSPRQFGSKSAKAIQTTKLILSGPAPQAAIDDGVVSKTDKKLCGLYALLKTGHLNQFDCINVAGKTQQKVYPLFSTEETQLSAYSYDLKVQAMERNEIDPTIGPVDQSVPSTLVDERISNADTVAETLAGIRIAPAPVPPAASTRRRRTAASRTTTSAPTSVESDQQQSPPVQQSRTHGQPEQQPRMAALQQPYPQNYQQAMPPTYQPIQNQQQALPVYAQSQYQQVHPPQQMQHYPTSQQFGAAQMYQHQDHFAHQAQPVMDSMTQQGPYQQVQPSCQHVFSQQQMVQPQHAAQFNQQQFQQQSVLQPGPAFSQAHPYPMPQYHSMNQQPYVQQPMQQPQQQQYWQQVPPGNPQAPVGHANQLMSGDLVNGYSSPVPSDPNFTNENN